jgi:hypothetical protein
MKNAIRNSPLFWRNIQFRRNILFRGRLWSILAISMLLGMESTAVALWYQALFAPAGVSWAGILGLLFTVLCASLLMLQAMQRFRWSRFARQAVFIVWLVLAAFASLKLFYYLNSAISISELVGMPVRYIIRSDVSAVNFYHLVVIALLVWRGVSLANKPVNLTGVQVSFQLWLILLLLYGMLFAPLYPTQATLGLYLFLFCGLVAMSSARVASLSEARGGRIPRFGFGWMASIVASALALVGLSILVSWMAGGRVVQILSGVLMVIFAILTALVLFLLSPLLLYLAGHIPQLADLIQQLLTRLSNLPYSEQIARLIAVMNEALKKVVPYILATRALVLVGILALLVLVILLALYIRGSQARTVLEEETSRIEPGAQDNPLQKLLRRLLQGARAMRGYHPAQLLAAARVRHIYRQLLALSKKMGAERLSSITPLEFLPSLVSLLPGEDDSLGLITRAYLKVRYGEYPETRQEVESVEAAWKRVRKKGRELRSMRHSATGR